MLRRTMVFTAAALVVASTLAIPTTAAAATGPTLAGAWAPLNRCPVDDPAMLAADGVSIAAACLSSSAASGTFTIGESTLVSGATDLQLGMLNQGGTYSTVPPATGAVVGDPVEIPGGLLGLMCPGTYIPIISEICRQVVDSPTNRVTATIQAAGAPTDFNLGAGVGVGTPILTLPVKIKLDNPFLGANCYIGSNANPIVLKPANLARPTGRVVRFNADGTPSATGQMGYLSMSGASQGDSTFAVPKSSGCGTFGILSGAVDAKQHLPSPAGANSLVLNDVVTNLGGFQTPRNFAPTQGQQLSQRWHAAVVG